MTSLLPLARYSLRLASTSPRLFRPLSTSLSRRAATPEWTELIGGREVVDRKRAAFEAKYKAAVEKKARAEGLNVEELKKRAEEQKLKEKPASLAPRAPPASGPVEAGSGAEGTSGEVVRPLPSAEKAPEVAKKQCSSGVKVRPTRCASSLVEEAVR